MRMAAPSPTMAGELVAEDDSDSVGATSGKLQGWRNNEKITNNTVGCHIIASADCFCRAGGSNGNDRCAEEGGAAWRLAQL